MEQFSYGETLLEVKDVSLSYNGRPILSNVNVKIRDIIRPNQVCGQIIGLLAPSGMGKSQLMRIISGLNQPTSGMVSINNSGKPVTAGEVGVVAQSYELFNHRTVMANLMLSASRGQKNENLAKEKVLEYLNEFELADKRNLYPAQLSGGQRQRVAIIQQILCSEHFLILDEPFSGLDLIMLEKTCALLSRIANMHELNTVLVVTHDVTAAASISDHLWMLGREIDAEGNKVAGAKIMKEYCLIERNLCWHPEIITTKQFTDFVGEVKEDFRRM